MKKIILVILAAFGLTSCSKSNINPQISPSQPANGIPVSVTINQNQPGYVIPVTFQGFSFEVGILPKLPSFLNANNTVLIQLIKNLGSGILRIGGNSSDKTSLTNTNIDTFSAFAKATGWQVIFGLNLGSYSPDVAATEASYLSNSLGSSLYVLQNGNEPDLFYNNGIRNPSYSYSDYQAEWNNYFSAIRKLLPQAPFAGPDVSNNTKWISSFSANESANVKLIDGHYYNSGPGTNPAITYQTLLAPNTRLSAYLKALNTASSQAHLPYRISECNSIYGGGKVGVSNVFASALWALDYMWQVAENNGSGVNFHGGNSGSYSPIALDNNVITARPEYYAMLAFKYGTTSGTIVPATISQTNSNCSAYACTNASTTYLTLINKDAADLSFTVQLSNAASKIQIARLTAPTITSTTGTTFAGTSVNADGTYQTGQTENYTVSQKTFIVNVPAGSAAVVTVN
ncbi:glycosyl hydrolase family protein [Pedobacter cryoconitis]|uniref:Beta-glucuronidase C-terminal domain-containing protein n=1 Tax=Pedobacter cryoconitis TaxID=188932 RepID=A0A7X0J4U3_9SPHI|nr:glycosyl hydrolase family protein [Pedobacter cryoconitis]MBB6499842.1 hypothetical protein [Pedobacter cryoconitis]